MALVEYISSMGIGVLVKFHRQLKAVSGVLRVLNPHDNVLAVLKIVNLAEVLVASEETPRCAISDAQTRRWERSGTVFESHGRSDGCILEGRLQGRPEKFASGQLSAAECCRVRFGPEVFGLGLGSFGNDATDSSKRIGEFLAAGGAAI